MSDRTTPETDAARGKGIWRNSVNVEFAETLERQRDEARAEIEVHQAFHKVAVSERNDAWIQERKIKEQRDQLREALEAALEHIPTTLQGEAKAAITAAKGTK